MSDPLDLVKKAWQCFEPPKCKECGSQNCIIENTLGCSDTSGTWGSIKLVCKNCNNTLNLSSDWC